jgi:hypothetical protein
MSSKKGSMELGVNAIVVLIIALVILGLAIAFVTNLFRSGGDQLGSIVENTKLSVHATASEPIKFEKTEISIRQGRRETVVISVYNDGFATASAAVRPVLVSCQDSLGTDSTSYFTLNTPGQIITPGSEVGYKAVMQATADAPDETHICTIEIQGGDTVISSQVIVEVTL